MNRINQEPVTFVLSPAIMARAKNTKGETAHVCWWLENFELAMDRLADDHGMDEKGNFCIRFILSPEEREIAASTLLKFYV